jgi:predicted ester cyclase
MKKLILGMAIVSCFLAACTGKSSVTISTTSDSTATYLTKIKQAAMSSDSAYAKRDVITLVKDYAPGFIEYGNGESKAVTNMDTIKGSAKSFFEAFPDFKGEDFKVVAEDSTVIITGTWSGTFKKEFMKIKPTNKAFKVFDADIFTFNKAGKITSHKDVQSDAAFFNQLGIPMPKKK